MLRVLGDVTSSSIGASEQADDAGEGGTLMPETPPRFLLLDLKSRVVDLAAAFLRKSQMPKQMSRQARSSKRGIHHHIRVCSLASIPASRKDVSGTTSVPSLLSVAAVLLAEPFASPSASGVVEARLVVETAPKLLPPMPLVPPTPRICSWRSCCSAVCCSRSRCSFWSLALLPRTPPRMPTASAPTPAPTTPPTMFLVCCDLSSMRLRALPPSITLASFELSFSMIDPEMARVSFWLPVQAALSQQWPLPCMPALP
mmetsp:Transcript_19851/g.38887  ORF Transcript_19851/g.38887 Transcript_19851/m.38887 type:complete len:257 (+) Transcript_19851:871-1641(+)